MPRGGRKKNRRHRRQELFAVPDGSAGSGATGHRMQPPGPAMVGALPRPVWGAVLGLLSSRPRYSEHDPYYEYDSVFEEDEEAWARSATVLELRLTCKALWKLVRAGCVGGAGWLRKARRLSFSFPDGEPETAGLGRALVVKVDLPYDAGELCLAVERGHMVWCNASFDKHQPAVVRMIEVVLLEASRKGLLLRADLRGSGWSIDTLAQLSDIKLYEQERATVAKLVRAGTLQRIWLEDTQWADLSILSSLRMVELRDCVVNYLSPLADVPELILSLCEDIEALPAMRNDVLEVDCCFSLTDVSGLAGGRVGRLELRDLPGVEDVSAIGAMRPPPRTVVLWDMDEVQDVSMLAGVRRLVLHYCPKLDKAATLAALEGKVGTIKWVEDDDEDDE